MLIYLENKVSVCFLRGQDIDPADSVVHESELAQVSKAAGRRAGVLLV